MKRTATRTSKQNPYKWALKNTSHLIAQWIRKKPNKNNNNNNRFDMMKIVHCKQSEMDIMQTEIAAHKSSLLFDLSDEHFDTVLSPRTKCNLFLSN